MLYEIVSEQLSVKISDVGAEIKSVKFNGKECAWQNESGLWDGCSPVLFPVCGYNSVVIDGTELDMPRHGFASRSIFAVSEQKSDGITFLLESNEATKKYYPFAFRLYVKYSVKSDLLVVENIIENIGDKPMPYAIGRHDSFVLDKPIENYKLCFPLEEEFLSQKHDESGRLMNLYYDFGSGKELILPADYLTDGQTVIFSNIKSDSVTLKTVDNRPIARFFIGDTNNLLLWRPDNAQMICVEPWGALPDDTDEDKTDFLQKKRFRIISEGETDVIKYSIEYFSAEND